MGGELWKPPRQNSSLPKNPLLQVQDKAFFPIRSSSDYSRSPPLQHSGASMQPSSILWFPFSPFASHKTLFTCLPSVKYKAPAGTSRTVTATASFVISGMLQVFMFLYFDILRPSISQEWDGAYVLKPATWMFQILKSHHYAPSPQTWIFRYTVLHFIRWSLLQLFHF